MFRSPRLRSDPALSVVVVTYNSKDTIRGLLNSFAEGLAGAAVHEVLVVDNASSDGTAELAEAHHIHPRVIRTGRNGGYAAGINAATRVIDPDNHVLVLNPDIRLYRGAGKALMTVLRDPGISIAVPRIYHEDGSLVPTLRREPSIVTAWADALLIRGLGRRVDLGETIHNRQRYESFGFAEWASGAALAISADARRAIGEWDETFFLYSEEVDFQTSSSSARLQDRVCT